MAQRRAGRSGMNTGSAYTVKHIPKGLALWAMSTMLLAGCASMDEESLENDISSFRGRVLETIQGKIEKLPTNRDFYCGVLEGWPIWCRDSRNADHETLYHGLVADGVYSRFGAVKRGVDSSGSHDALKADCIEKCKSGHLGEEILASLRKCRIGDAVSVGSIRNKMVRTSCLAWFGNDESSMAGVAIITVDEVYFIYTRMEFVEKAYLVVDIFAELPYYLWQNPMLGQCRLIGEDEEGEQCALGEIREKMIKMYPDGSVRSILFDDVIAAFRLDISPERFKTEK